MTIRTGSSAGPYDAWKRFLDVAVSAGLLVVLAPLMIALGIAVAGTSRGGILFRQERVGRGRKPFRILKFRTMDPRAGAERGSFDLGSTRRVTTVGRWLRASKLDELPQIVNVLRGEMSLVGPRPEVPKWTEVHRERWDRALEVRPGITDLASIEFRDEESILAASGDAEAAYRDRILPRKLELAERYVQDRSLSLDLRILWATVVAVVRPRRDP